MPTLDTLSGNVLREMLVGATTWLEDGASHLDALNVFPVPDGDTGSNMLLTMQAAVREARTVDDNDVSRVAHAFARGALLGASGNSGVILSQYWQGWANELHGKACATSADLCAALRQASELAVHAVSRPVEGTILTVMRDAATAAGELTPNDIDLVSVLERVVCVAAESVARTPSLLPVLKNAGVVDAGAKGLQTIFRGALAYLRDEPSPSDTGLREASTVSLDRIREAVADEGALPGYCTEFIVDGVESDVEQIRSSIEAGGSSVVVVGRRPTVRVHVHASDPAVAIRSAAPFGTLRNVRIWNMDRQRDTYFQTHEGSHPSTNLAVIAVARGGGLMKTFASLGAEAVVYPNAEDLLAVLQATTAKQVIVLLNGVDSTLDSVLEAVAGKEIYVVPSRTISQGIAAMVAFNTHDGVQENVRAMTEALAQTVTVELASATRTEQRGSLDVREAQIVVLLNAESVLTADTPAEALCQALRLPEMADIELATIYYGNHVLEQDAQAVGGRVQRAYPELEIEVLYGGQVDCDYLVSTE